MSAPPDEALVTDSIKRVASDISVVKLDDYATVSVRMSPISKVPTSLSYSGGGTCFHPAALSACELASGTPPTHAPVVVFMSDGCAYDAAQAAGAFSQLNREIRHSHRNDLELHVMDLLAFPFAGCCVEPGTTYRRTKLCRSVLAYVFFVHIL